VNILITGAGGFIGSHLVDRCCRDGHYVVGVDRKQLGDWSRGSSRYDVERCMDARDIHRLSHGSQSFDQFDLCFHLAADARIQPSFHSPVEYCSNNIMSTVHVLDFCRQLSVRMVYAGSSTADDDVTKNVYAASKFTGETLCRTWSRCFGLSTAIARFYNVYGARQIEEGVWATVVGIFERQWRSGEKLTVTGDGHQRRDFTHVDDIVEGLLAVSERGGASGEVHGLGTGANHSVLDVARMFVDDDRIEFVPSRPGESEVTLADVARTEREIGFRAIRRLPEYVEEVKRCPC